MRVLLANDRLGYDDALLHGAGRVLIEWTRALLHRGIDVITVVLRDSGRIRQQVATEGLPLIFLDRARYDPRTLLDFASLIRNHRIQLLHLQGFGASTFGRLAGLMLQIPTIVHVHADYRAEPLGYPRLVRAVDRVLAPVTDLAIAISGPVAEFATRQQGFPSNRIRVIHNPVDTHHFRPANEVERSSVRKRLGLHAGDSVVACVSRLHPVKGIDQLLDAWALIGSAMPDAVLLIAGDGPESAKLKNRAATLAPPDRIRFLGHQADVRSVLWASDVLVVPSRQEGLSLAALEAMATGLPVVAFRVGGLPEIVSHEINGLLAAAFQPSELAAATLRVLRDPSLRRTLSHGARQTAESHDTRCVVAQLEETYTAVLEKRRT